MTCDNFAAAKAVATGLQIAELRVHSIAIADPPLRSSYGLHAPYALRTIIELDSRDGVVGLGETHGGEGIAQALASIKPKLAGADPFRLLGEINTRLGSKRAGTSQDRSQTYLVPGENPLDLEARINSVLEIACLDLIGKAIGKPVCDLLGARARDEVAFSAYAFYKHAGGGGEGDDKRADVYGEALTPEAIVRQLKQMIAEYGFDEVKLKAGVLDPQIEIETIRRLRAALGREIPLRLDPNCAWSVETSVKIGKALQSELDNGGYLEDPTAGLAGMAQVRKKLGEARVETPLASNVAVTSFADLPESVRTDAVQIVLCDPHYWGGIRQVQHLGKVCETFGLGLSMHSNSHLGVSLMAMAHAAASTPHLTYACDTHYPWQTAQDEVICGGRVKFVRGRVRIPDSPGLGISLDHDQLARLRERYAKSTFRKRDDEAEMRKHVDPNWRRVLPRW
ncbi:MAG TPA: enolase C-terminal domain-like protein [Candidatus Aquilonibacter sp.]|nr:enolase C-terminal domain-like protein [Candidatus Aquilonibacter sp.]